MWTIEAIDTIYGKPLHDAEGNKIGTISDVYLDRQSGEPEWMTVKTGIFGTHVSFVPLQAATGTADDLRVPFDKDHVKDAPRVDHESQLSPEDERRLYEHYSMQFGDFDYDREYDADRDDDTGRDFDTGHDTSGPDTDDAMTRSEEELRIGTTQVEQGRARLRKYVVTENVQQTVPVQREEVRLEREPITDENVGDAMDGPAISEEEHEVTLYAEEPVVEKQAVPKERVRLGKEKITEEEQIAEDLRREEIESSRH